MFCFSCVCVSSAYTYKSEYIRTYNGLQWGSYTELPDEKFCFDRYTYTFYSPAGLLLSDRVTTTGSSAYPYLWKLPSFLMTDQQLIFRLYILRADERRRGKTVLYPAFVRFYLIHSLAPAAAGFGLNLVFKETAAVLSSSSTTIDEQEKANLAKTPV